MKKIVFKKETIVNLSVEQMNKVRGATILHFSCLCNDTESCTLLHQCCTPPEQKIVEKDIV
jgi:hypothetical protein